MNWKKNVFSYLLWLVYTAAVCVGVLDVTVSICCAAAYPQWLSFVMAAGFFAVLGLLVLGIRKFWQKCDLPERMAGSMTARVIEILVVVALLAVGVWQRLDFSAGISDSVAGMEYFEAAVVAADKHIPRVVHGATYLYLNLLHQVFFLFGNKPAAAIGCQVFLQVLSGVLFYLSVRKLAGKLAGAVTMAMLMLSPYMIGEVLSLSPAFLFFVLYSFVLLLIGSVLSKGSKSPVWYAFAGILSGIVIYLDIFGVTLFLFWAGVLLAEKETQEGFRNSRAAVLFFGILGAAAGFFLTIGVDAYVSGAAFIDVLTAWAEIYQPGNFILMEIGAFPDTAVMIGVLTIGIFSFWCRRDIERQSVWTAVTVVLAMLQSFQVMTQNAGSSAYIWFFLAALAGIAAEEVFAADFVTEREGAESKDTEAKAEKGSIIDLEVSAIEKIEETSPKVSLLENPLPLPKKHTPKVLDYGLTDLAEGSDYDYEVAEDADFDIK